MVGNQAFLVVRQSGYGVLATRLARNDAPRQARFMIPMAISLGFGIAFATVITLLLVPCLYGINEDIRSLLGWRPSVPVPADSDPESAGS